jgi:hypothetical protein
MRRELPWRVSATSTATRDGSLGTLGFSASLLDDSFSVLNTVANRIELPGTVPGGGNVFVADEGHHVQKFACP